MPGPKQNNNRKYANANHQPRHKAADRIGKAQARQEASDALSLNEKIAKLPPEPFAKKVRAKLLARLAKQNEPKSATKNELAQASSSENKQQAKKYMKGSK